MKTSVRSHQSSRQTLEHIRTLVRSAVTPAQNARLSTHAVILPKAKILLFAKTFCLGPYPVAPAFQHRRSHFDAHDFDMQPWRSASGSCRIVQPGYATQLASSSLLDIYLSKYVGRMCDTTIRMTAAVPRVVGIHSTASRRS